jgi:hypothetical protein
MGEEMSGSPVPEWMIVILCWIGKAVEFSKSIFKKGEKK